MIHIVEDDDAVRAALCMTMRSFGWPTRAFASAHEFLKDLPIQEPDCLVLDLNMPGMNGVELLEILAARHRGFPVVVITGEPGSPLALRARDAGAYAVVEKPFVDEKLKSVIESALGA